VLLEAESSACGTDGNRENMCFSFSTKDLCERPLTDHNYYAVCAVSITSTKLIAQLKNSENSFQKLYFKVKVGLNFNLGILMAGNHT